MFQLLVGVRIHSLDLRHWQESGSTAWFIIWDCRSPSWPDRHAYPDPCHVRRRPCGPPTSCARIGSAISVAVHRVQSQLAACTPKIIFEFIFIAISPCSRWLFSDLERPVRTKPACGVIGRPKLPVQTGAFQQNCSAPPPNYLKLDAALRLEAVRAMLCTHRPPPPSGMPPPHATAGLPPVPAALALPSANSGTFTCQATRFPPPFEPSARHQRHSVPIATNRFTASSDGSSTRHLQPRLMPVEGLITFCRCGEGILCATKFCAPSCRIETSPPSPEHGSDSPQNASSPIHHDRLHLRIVRSKDKTQSRQNAISTCPGYGLPAPLHRQLESAILPPKLITAEAADKDTCTHSPPGSAPAMQLPQLRQRA